MKTMTKRICCLFAAVMMAAVILLPLSADAANTPDQTAEIAVLPANPRLSYNAGSCRRMEGKPYVVVIYLDDDVSNWTEEEVKFHQENLINLGLAFIEENAKKWGVFLDIGVGYYTTYGHPDRPVKYNGIVENYNDGKPVTIFWSRLRQHWDMAPKPKCTTALQNLPERSRWLT